MNIDELAKAQGFEDEAELHRMACSVPIDTPALMGGMYKGECPSCSAQNLPLGRMVVEVAKGFAVVEDPAPTPPREESEAKP